MHSRNLRTAVAGLVLGTLITLVVYTTPPTASSVGSLRYNALSPDTAEDGRRRRCLPQRHVMFLKTHKCASSTVQNIFFRYGYRHNLTFALPEKGNYLGNPSHFTVDLIPKSLLPRGDKVDIFAVHTRLKYAEHAKILHNDTRWITIVRDPSSLYESLYNFFHLGDIYGVRLQDFSQVPMADLMELPRYGGKFGRNQMLFDLGYPDNTTVSELLSAIDFLDGLFDLVMIAEFIDESLILMRHLLCWSLHDIVYFTKNARRQEVKPALNPETVYVLKELNSADGLLYQHFVARHQQAVLRFGMRRMAQEVSMLRNLRKEYFRKCGTQEVTGQDSALLYKEYSGQVNAYLTANNSSQDCLILSLPELSLVDAIRLHQSIALGKT